MSVIKKPKARLNVKTRRCLMCGDAFESDGAHNRICRKCKETKAWREGASISDYTLKGHG
ncbi:MAG: hypothetical protein H6907_19760 [Hyphomicrobiales bacterium]|nr:hypothetical protein [Hyphomicrobiales bacterium]